MKKKIGALLIVLSLFTISSVSVAEVAKPMSPNCYLDKGIWICEY
ncbi:hypothetical protein [Heyndrickxia oleronia]